VQSNQNAIGNAIARKTSLCICLAALQVLNFLGFIGVLRCDWLVDWRFLTTLASVLILIPSSLWLIGRHGFAFDKSDENRWPVLPLLSKNSLTWNPISWIRFGLPSYLFFVGIAAPAFWFVEFVPPDHSFSDGPFHGKKSIAELQIPVHYGCIEFVDGKVRHDLGGGVEYKYSQSGPGEVYYVDPLVEDDWTLDKPVKAWVIHKKDKEPTARDRYGYIVSQNHAMRNTFRLAIKNSITHFQTVSDPNAVIVQLSSDLPDGNRPSYTTTIAFGFAFAALSVVFYVSRLVLEVEDRE
jgi:hypothetical protein